MDFAFFAINFNIIKNGVKLKKNGSSSIPQILNYPQMTFLFRKVLIFNVLYFKV